jgi:hypothetical protein
VEPSIFLDFHLPNAATWFYFSLLLAGALFFKFNRLLSVRNWDVFTLFLLVPGFLLLMQARLTDPADPAREWLLLAGYVWLLAGSGYFFVRCLFDLALVRRPALAPNLNLSGLAWLAAALFVCLGAVAVRRPVDADTPVGRPSVVEDELKRQAAGQVRQLTGAGAEDTATRFWVERGTALLCHLAIVAALVLIGASHFQDATAGMAMATFYLLLPYTAYHVGQVHHVWPTALLLWAVYCYRRPTFAGLFLGLAAGGAFFPLVVLPAWLSFYHRRGVGRFAGFCALGAAASLGLTALVLALDGRPLISTLTQTFNLADWLPWRVPDTESIWRGTHWAYRLPVFIAYAAFVLTTLFWPNPKNLAQVIALSAASLIGVQFWYADQGGVYVLWYLPLLLLLVFRPNLSDRQPLPIVAETDWLHRLGRWLGHGLSRLTRPPRPLAGVR